MKYLIYACTGKQGYDNVHKTRETGSRVEMTGTRSGETHPLELFNRSHKTSLNTVGHLIQVKYKKNINFVH